MSRFMAIALGGVVGAGALMLSPVAISASPVPSVALAKAARTAPLKEIDNRQGRCVERSVEQWLKELTGQEVRSIRWSGVACQLTGPGPLDGGGHWCGQADLILKHPKNRTDRPMIEVYFEKPVHGRPGKPYAFRGVMLTADGPDYSRFPEDFEADWRSRFPPRGKSSKACP